MSHEALFNQQQRLIEEIELRRNTKRKLEQTADAVQREINHRMQLTKQVRNELDRRAKDAQHLRALQCEANKRQRIAATLAIPTSSSSPTLEPGEIESSELSSSSHSSVSSPSKFSDDSGDGDVPDDVSLSSSGESAQKESDNEDDD